MGFLLLREKTGGGAILVLFEHVVMSSGFTFEGGGKGG